ncbi:MAG: hypothetical protein HZA64_14095 [Rhodocyclales bacterium]|jgi:hypothetical protein|nr:hypothetical protein [Rhodocyclales bacterium]
MPQNDLTPNDRASFNEALVGILSDHATLRRLAAATTSHHGNAADEAMSLAEAMETHERIEARLFALPLITRPPEIVISTAARAHQRCMEFATGTYHLPDTRAAVASFVDALLAHLAAEEAWLAQEDERQKERLSIIN